MAAIDVAGVEERARFLENACADDAALRERIETLLRLEAESPDFLTPADAPLPALPHAGETIGYFGDYVLLDEIARGSTGVVFRARQTSLHRIVALKMLRDRPLLTSEADTKRFRAEAEAAASLDHPHIVPIYEVGAHEGQAYFSMKLIEGGTLHFRAAEFQADARKAAALMATVARAVHHAHQKGILHRDLKPGNILIDAAGAPHVTDFGLARKIGLDSSLTVSGQIMGTPHYMAPEQARGENRALTPGADIYSLGAMLYELLSGRRPFTGEDFITLLKQVAETEPPRLRALKPALDRDIETVVMKCLEKSPTARYATAADLADDLERWQRGEPVRARPAGLIVRAVKWARRHPAHAALAGIAASSAVLFAAWAIAERETGPPTGGMSPHIVVTTAADELDSETPGTGLSLREAVLALQKGGRISFDPAVFNHAATSKIILRETLGEIEFTKSLHLDAGDISGGVTIQGGAGSSRIFTVGKSAEVSLTRLTLTGGKGGEGNRLHQVGGGAIFNEGHASLTDCILLNNSSRSNGGAIYSTGSLSLLRCTIAGNTTQFHGGGINLDGSSPGLTAVNCTLAANISEGGRGGAISISPSAAGATVSLTHCTIAGNAVENARGAGPGGRERGSGGGIRAAAGMVTLTNCIVAGNTAIVPGTGNLVGSIAQSGLNLTTGDPLLAPLASNGGPTQTMALLPGSPALDAAAATPDVATDQRGLPRSRDGNGDGTAAPDLGAFEVQAAP